MGSMLTVRGDLNRTYRFLKKMASPFYLTLLERYAQRGVDELRAATPVRTGVTAASWTYKITETPQGATITWSNTNVNDHVNIAMILQYGHGTRNGGWVEGIDYINPALQPVFDELAQQVWEEVKRA